MKRIKRILKSIYTILKKPEMAILPGNIAFFLILSIIPIITLIALIATSFSVSLEAITEFLSNNLPNEVLKILNPFIIGKGFGTNTMIYIIIGFYLASNGPKALIVASNTLYNIKGYNAIGKRIKALFITLILISLFIFLLIVLGFGNSIMNYIINNTRFYKMGENLYYIFILLKWPLAFIVIFVSVKLIYTLSPDKLLKSKYVNKGAFFTTVMWLIVTALYSFYANNIADYSIIYGNLSSIIILMIWVYALSFILVVGIAINSNNYKIMNKIENNVDNIKDA